MKTPLITREGYEKLKKEMDFLWREERPEVTKKVTWAASLGDRSGSRGPRTGRHRVVARISFGSAGPGVLCAHVRSRIERDGSRR